MLSRGAKDGSGSFARLVEALADFICPVSTSNETLLESWGREKEEKRENLAVGPCCWRLLQIRADLVSGLLSSCSLEHDTV